MSVMEMLTSAISAVMPKKSLDQVIEEQNTTTVRYPRVHGFSQKYVYGKVPGEPLVRKRRHPEGRQIPFCKSETDPAVIAEHLAICQSEEGSHGGLCEMCMRLNNPKRFDFLVRLYRDTRSLDQAGFNVSGAVEDSKVNQPATSAYLRQLANLGLIRRECIGRHVCYTPDISLAKPCVGEIARMMRDRMRSGSTDMSYTPIFRAMMGSLRSRIVRHIAAGGCGNAGYLREQFKIVQFCDLLRDMKPAIEAHILNLDSQDPDGNYTYVPPADPIARRIIELS